MEKVEVQAEKPAFQKQIEAIVATKQAEVAARQAPRQEVRVLEIALLRGCCCGVTSRNLQLGV